MEARRKKLCVYVGKQNKGKLKTVVKHKFCCFGNMLDKVVQVEGRKQLGINFGTGANPNCRGLTLEEIQRIDFDKLDFTEFIEDFKSKFFGKYKEPSIGDLKSRVESSKPNLKEYDGDPDNKENNKAGFNPKVMKDE